MEIMQTDRTSAWTELMFEVPRAPAPRHRFCGYRERVVAKGSNLCGRLAAPVNEVAERALGAAAPVIRLRADSGPMR